MKPAPFSLGKRQGTPKLVRVKRGGFDYEYYPIGRHVVIAPGVCGGRPTFKGTRIEVETILAWLRHGETIPEILEGYPSLSRPAIKEAIELAAHAFKDQYTCKAA